ncbi:multidrug efflux SMR transporter [Brevibacillus humidisoli]|uniref:DMT family transporter n=1 Tax=Brevibacillus humidisoli TaxID=2895522 RepID=UPI001E352DC6|nr:multidrug efflux SMR transporter [Brevibacillus humidisoli]UFJ42690.1 multidrug efflux SMR transporter [Brevibacillus humidisoli]
MGFKLRDDNEECRPVKAWIYLIIAGLFEVVWAVGLKYTQGFTRPIPSLITAGGMIISFYFLSQSLKWLPIGTGYAVWTGIGAAGTIIIGMIFMGEPKDWLRITFLLMIIGGIIGLKATSTGVEAHTAVDQPTHIVQEQSKDEPRP